MVNLSILVSWRYLIASIVFVFPFLGYQFCRVDSWIGFLTNSRYPDYTAESFHAIDCSLRAALVWLTLLICELVWHMLEPVLLAFNNAT